MPSTSRSKRKVRGCGRRRPPRPRPLLPSAYPINSHYTHTQSICLSIPVIPLPLPDSLKFLAPVALSPVVASTPLIFHAPPPFRHPVTHHTVVAPSLRNACTRSRPISVIYNNLCADPRVLSPEINESILRWLFTSRINLKFKAKFLMLVMKE